MSGPALPATSANQLAPVIDGVVLRDRTVHETDVVHRLVEIFLLEHQQLVGEYNEHGAIRAIRQATDSETPCEGAT